MNNNVKTAKHLEVKKETKCLFSVQAEGPLGKRFAFSFLRVMSDLQFSTRNSSMEAGMTKIRKRKLKKKNTI